MEKLGGWLNRFLLINVFMVFFFFSWFMVALAGESFHVHLGLKLWQSLWQPLIQPVLGIVMAGAITSGVIAKAKQILQQKNS